MKDEAEPNVTKLFDATETIYVTKAGRHDDRSTSIFDQVRLSWNAKLVYEGAVNVADHIKGKLVFHLKMASNLARKFIQFIAVDTKSEHSRHM